MVASILLIIIFVIAMYDNIHEAVVAVKGGAKGQQLDEPVTKKAVITNVVKFLIGAVGTVAGAQLLVDNGSALASMCGVSDRVISVTIIAIGTSLPELVTTLTAIAKKQGSLSAGNIIGANIIDLTLILPVCALIYGSKLPASPTVAMVAHAHHEEILALAGRFNARRLRCLHRAPRHCYGITCNFCNESSVFKKNGAFLCTFQIISS